VSDVNSTFFPNPRNRLRTNHIEFAVNRGIDPPGLLL
jgi:hypothetical protein